jgi:hypothetical protein
VISNGRCVRRDKPSTKTVFVTRGMGWSTYGARRAQTVATGRKPGGVKTRSNKPIRNRWQPTATFSQRMVKSMFATVCHRLPPVADDPLLVREGVEFRASQRG